MNFKEAKWKGRPNYSCQSCPFSTMDLGQMTQHQLLTHRITEWPKVSCITPTFNRREFLPFAIQQFLRYDYPNKEMVILDDGTDSVEDLVPKDLPFITYERLEERQHMGWKRNRLCEMASGEYIAHHDDDDFYHSSRLTDAMSTLLYSGKSLTGIRDAFFFLRKGVAYQYRYGMETNARAVGATLVYSKDLWSKIKFIDKRDLGEDTMFVRSVPEGLALCAPKSNKFVSYVHDSNISAKERPDPFNPGQMRPIRNYDNREAWTPVPVEQVLKMMGDDRTFYQMGMRPQPLAKVLIAAVATDNQVDTVEWIAEAMAEVANLRKCGVDAEIALAIDGDESMATVIAEASQNLPVKIHVVVNKEKRGLPITKNMLGDILAAMRGTHLLWWKPGVKAAPNLPIRLLMEMGPSNPNLGVLVPKEGPGTGQTMAIPDWTNYSLWSAAVKSEGVIYDEIFSLEGLGGLVEEWDLLYQLTVKGFVLQYYEGIQLLSGKLQDPEVGDAQQDVKKREYLQSKWSRLSAAG